MQCNLRLRCPFGPKRAADDHHMKPPNGSMSKEAESPVDEAPHRDQGACGQGLVDKFSLITTSSCRAGTSSEGGTLADETDRQKSRGMAAEVVLDFSRLGQSLLCSAAEAGV